MTCQNVASWVLSGLTLCCFFLCTLRVLSLQNTSTLATDVQGPGDLVTWFWLSKGAASTQLGLSMGMRSQCFQFSPIVKRPRNPDFCVKWLVFKYWQHSFKNLIMGQKYGQHLLSLLLVCLFSTKSGFLFAFLLLFLFFVLFCQGMGKDGNLQLVDANYCI